MFVDDDVVLVEEKSIEVSERLKKLRATLERKALEISIGAKQKQ